MKRQPPYIPPALLGLAACTAAIEAGIAPGIWGQTAAVAASIAIVALGLAQRYGVGPVRRAFSAVLLGGFLGMIFFSMGTTMIGMGFGQAIPRKWLEPVCLAAGLCPLLLGAYILSHYPAPRFIRYAFIGGLFLTPVLVGISFLFGTK